MKKVLFSLTYYTPYVSGLTIYVQRLVDGLLKKELLNGIDITILTSQYDRILHSYGTGDEKSVRLAHDLRNIGRVHIIRVPYLLKISKGFIMPSYIWESYKAVKSNDAVFVNLPQVEGFIVSLWAKLLHKKLCAIYHCDLILPKGIFNFLINKIVILCNSITLYLADKIIVYTNEYAETSTYLQKYKNKFLQIYPPIYPLPIDEKYFQELQDNHPSSEFKLGFAARIAEEKGLEYLIDVIKSMENIKLFIAGPKEGVAGEAKYVKKINKILEENKNKVVFLGALNESQMGAFYKFINLLVVPSVNRTEAFGLVQAEAMFAGRPIVATNLPGVRFLIEQTGAGEIAQIKNTEDLKEKIEQIKNNYQKYQEDTKKIFQIINLDKTINLFIDLIS